MNPPNINYTLIETYIGLLEKLNSNTKMELISRLTHTLNSFEKKDDVSLDMLYGAFVSEKTAEAICKEIKQSRNFKRKRISF